MAHAGTPTDLAKQPATSTNGFWQVLITMIALLALGAGMIFVTSNVASSNRGVAAPAVDHRFDQIEGQRGATTLSAADGSYTQVETNRGGALNAADSSTTKVEGLRGGALTVTPDAKAPKLGGTAPDYGNGKVQGHRGGQISQ